MTDRGEIKTDTLLKALLALAVVWLALDIVTIVVQDSLLTPFKPILGLVVIIILFLRLLDQI